MIQALKLSKIRVVFNIYLSTYGPRNSARIGVKMVEGYKWTLRLYSPYNIQDRINVKTYVMNSKEN